jgi:hypothetical protein
MNETKTEWAEVWRWIRPSWARFYSLAFAAPAVWAIWVLVLEANQDKLIVMLACAAWLFFVLRIWFWYEKPKPS